MVGFAGLILSLCVFVVLSFKNWNVAVISFIASSIVMISNGINIFDGFKAAYSTGFASFASNWWLMFALGALFGNAVKELGFSESIVKVLQRYVKGESILLVLLISLIMSYGGISTFVIAFTLYPIASRIFEDSKISSDLLPAAILFCPTTLSMTMLPGSPSIQNLIPTDFLNTDIYAAPFLGLFASVIVFALGYFYLSWTAKCKGKIQAKSIENSCQPSDFWSLLPCVSLWLLSFFLIHLGNDSRIAVEISMLTAILLCFAIRGKRGNIKSIINDGVSNGLKTLALTSSVMGYGAVVQKSDIFAHFAEALFQKVDNPLLSAILIVNVIAAITGSSTTALQMFFNMFGNHYVNTSISMPALHRIIAIASGGLDSMPYATGVVVTSDLSKVPLAKSYLHIFVTCAVIPLVALMVLLVFLAFYTMLQTM